MLEEEYQPRRQLPYHLRKPPEPEAPFSYELRDATPRDLPDIREIYNYYVVNSVVTFDEDQMTLKEWKAKFALLTKMKMPFIVAVSPNGDVLGYALVQQWKPKAAYRYTVENSIYIRPAATGKGLGKALLGELIARAKQAGLKEILAVIADKGAEGSVKLHESFGFKEIGRMGRVGYKFERWLGTVMLQKSLK